MSIQLTDDQAERLREAIRSLTHHWHSNPNGSDYRCEFCGNTADTNNGDVTHDKNCEGEEFSRILEGNSNE